LIDLNQKFYSKTETVMIILNEMENELDVIKSRVEKMRGELLDLAKEEVERAKEEAIEEIMEKKEEILADY